MPAKRIVSPYTPVPVPPADRPQLGPWRVVVVRVEETPREMLPERNPPVLQRIGKGQLIYLKLLVMMIQFCWPGPPRAGSMKFDGPAGRSSHSEKTREPLQLMVHAQTDPAGQFSAGQFSATSNCYPVGPVGLDATGGPVGPDVYFTNPNLLTHVIRTPPDPDGQDTITGPAGPYVGGGPVGPAHGLLALKSCKHLISDHADPVVQHEAKSDTTELLEYKVVDNILDGRPTKGIAWSELLKYSIRLLDSSLDGKLEEEISDWEPEASPMTKTNLESGHMIMMLCSVPSEQFVPDSCSVVRAVEDATEEDLFHNPVMSPVQDNDPDGQLREVKEYDNPIYMKKTEETQFSYDTELSDQKLEDAIRLEIPRNRLGRQVNVTDPDISMDNLRSEGWRRWNTDMDTENQYETFNGLPVYYGGDLYDSDDLEEFWLDTPEEMDNKIRNQSRPDGG